MVVDLHPVTFDEHGTGWHRGANQNGSDCPYPADGFGEGRILDQMVPCLRPALQLTHHGGYATRDRDHAGVRHPAHRFGLTLTDAYRPREI